MILVVVCLMLMGAIGVMLCYGKPLGYALFNDNPHPMPKSSSLQHRLVQIHVMLRSKEALPVQNPCTGEEREAKDGGQDVKYERRIKIK